MTNKPQTDKIDQASIDLGQKEAAMEKLGKEKMDHMGDGKKSKPADAKPKHGTDGRLPH